MHSNVTKIMLPAKKVCWPHFSWATLYSLHVICLLLRAFNKHVRGARQMSLWVHFLLGNTNNQELL